MYDALLGGTHNFAVDRQAAAQAAALVPDLPNVARSNRAFLRRAVRHLVEAGIGQFVDIGAGIPTVGNSHEVAQRADPRCRVAYVDIDPVAVAHAQAILARDPDTTAIQGDLRAPARLLANRRLRDFVDLDQPVGVLLVAVLHLLTDADEPHRVVATLRDAVAPGSYLVISHLSSAQRPEDAARLGAHAATRTGVPIIFRSRQEITAFFDGLTVLEPGVVELPAWRPETPEDRDEAPGRSLGLAGAGRKE
jgi:SAM-dependent methyltransferase